MKIEFTKNKHLYRADCLNLPGTPPVGIGTTKELALGDLFLKMYFEKTKNGCWFDYVKQDGFEFIDG